MSFVLFRLAALALLLTAATEASAEETGTISVQIENDRVANTDRHYTHGTRFDWVSDKTTDGPDWVREGLNSLYPLADMRAGRIGFSIGQSIFTPTDTTTKQPVANDRPYAGWLYVGASVHAETSRHVNGQRLDALDSVELDLGIVGPQAYGRNIQNGFHDLIQVDRAMGWNEQLKNEPAVALFFSRTWRPQPWKTTGLEADILPQIGGSLGNVYTHADAGLVARFGQGLDIDFGPTHIRPSSSGIAAIEPLRNFSWYTFIGASGRAVARNIFLDGNTFVDSPNVDKNPFVADFQLGVVLAFSGYRVTFSQVFRTPEFKEQIGSDRFGSLTLSARF
ncbi:MAG: lipid A deacylase LpxR family protein [Rhodospirillaceae bacterium]|nr:lipid A deacylase LpxR family protein [Rhodospirillaceae bacterium]